jgi:hypothetical protein
MHGLSYARGQWCPHGIGQHEMTKQEWMISIGSLALSAALLLAARLIFH